MVVEGLRKIREDSVENQWKLCSILLSVNFKIIGNTWNFWKSQQEVDLGKC